MKSFRKTFYKIATVILVTAVCYAVCEGTVYFLFRKQIVLFPRYVTGVQYGDFHIRRNIPHAQYRHKSYDGEWRFKINGQGFRSDHEVAYEKKSGLIRILVLGDSFTVGYEVNAEQTYGAVLEKTLKEKGYPVEVINSGVSGYSNAEELIFFEQEGLRYHPDIVVLGFFINDLSDNIRADLFRLADDRLILNHKDYLPAIRERDFLNSFSFYRWLSEHSYLHNYLNQAAAVYAKEKLQRQNAEDIRKHLRVETENYEAKLSFALIKKIHEIARQNGIYFVLMDIPTPDLRPSFPERYDASKISDHFMNTIDLFKKYTEPSRFYRLHGHHHWTESAHEIAGRHLAEILEPAMIQEQKKV